MKVLITGATGFMGSSLADRYLDKGAEVIAVGLGGRPEEKENTEALEKHGARVVCETVTNRDLMRSLLADVDLVFHFAVAMREAGKGDDYFEQVNVDATKMLLEESKAAGVSRFVYCSTVGIVGHKQGDVNNEEAPPNPGDIYQRTKMEAEKIVLAYPSNNGFATTAMRPADVYGPRDRRLLKLFRGVKKGKFPLFGSGKGKRHLVHVEDCNDLFERVAEDPKAVGETFIGAGPEAPTLREILDALEKITGGKAPHMSLPYWPLKLAAAVIEDVCTPLHIEPPIYRRRVAFYAHDYEFDISKAKRVLGWQPKIHMEDGLRETFEWYVERGLIE